MWYICRENKPNTKIEKRKSTILLQHLKQLVEKLQLCMYISISATTSYIIITPFDLVAKSVATICCRLVHHPSTSPACQPKSSSTSCSYKAVLHHFLCARNHESMYFGASVKVGEAGGAAITNCI